MANTDNSVRDKFLMLLSKANKVLAQWGKSRSSNTAIYAILSKTNELLFNHVHVAVNVCGTENSTWTLSSSSWHCVPRGSQPLANVRRVHRGSVARRATIESIVHLNNENANPCKHKNSWSRKSQVNIWSSVVSRSFTRVQQRIPFKVC